MKRAVTLVIIGLVLLFVGTSCSPEEQPTDADTWAFCGVSPHDAHADAKTRALSMDANIDATFGPCLPPPADYTTVNPGTRYLSPDGYLSVTLMNAKYDMGTVVFDARVWSTDATTRQQAIDYWSPVIDHVVAWDMGDEFDPALPDWQVLITRWNTVLKYVTPVTDVPPYTNHLPWALDEALRDLSGAAEHLSFDQYDVDASVATAASYNLKATDLMCAVNTLDHGDLHPTPWGVISDMQLFRDSGCDSFLIFGGDMPIDTPGFTQQSLVTKTGNPTLLAEAVAKGSQ